ncbi:hypothetical protein CR513_38074, partial [Mucuna pruriens]
MVNEIGVVDNLRLENQLTELTSLVRQVTVGQHQPSISARVWGICTSVEHPIDMCPTLQETELDHPESVGAIGGTTIPAVATTESASSRQLSIFGGPNEAVSYKQPRVPTNHELEKRLVQNADSLSAKTELIRSRQRRIRHELNTKVGIQRSLESPPSTTIALERRQWCTSDGQTLRFPSIGVRRLYRVITCTASNFPNPGVVPPRSRETLVIFATKVRLGRDAPLGRDALGFYWVRTLLASAWPRCSRLLLG